MKIKSFLFIAIAVSLSICSKANPDSLAKWRAYIDTTTNKKTKEFGRCYYKIGQWYSHGESKLDSCIYYMEKAKDVFEEIGERRAVGTTYYSMGISYIHQNNKKKAIEALTKSENIFIEIKDTATLLFASLARADQLPASQKIDKLKDIAVLANKIGNVGAEISCYGNIGDGYFQLEQLDSALVYHKKQYHLNNNNQDKRTDYKRKMYEHNNHACLSIGNIYYEQKKYNEAFTYYKRSYEAGKKISSTYHGISNAAGKIIILADEWEKQKPNEYALYSGSINKTSLLKEAQQVASESQSYIGAMLVIKGFLSYYKKRGNRDSVILYQNKLIAMKDSFYRDEQIQASAKFSEELKTADKEKEIVQLNADKKIASATANRNKIIFILILLGLLSSIYFIIKRIKYKNLKEQEERDKNFRSKLSSDLHDDVGTILTSLSMQSELLEMKASEGNKGTVSKIAGMSRDATRRMRDTVWAIDSRKDNIMDLAYRMIDFAEDILEPKDVEFQLDHNIENKEDKISAELRQNIFLIFKEAITNAAKYGTGELVTASLQKENDRLNLIISNLVNAKVDITEVSGLGLSNIKKRTEDMRGHFVLENKNNSFQIGLSFSL